MQEEAALFKVLGDPIRLRMAVLMSIRGETCVCRLAAALAEPAFKISRHLRIMRAAGMVTSRREGTWMHYRLAAPRHRLEQCLQECFRECLAEHQTVREDLVRLDQGACSKGGRSSNDR